MSFQDDVRGDMTEEEIADLIRSLRKDIFALQAERDRWAKRVTDLEGSMRLIRSISDGRRPSGVK